MDFPIKAGMILRLNDGYHRVTLVVLDGSGSFNDEGLVVQCEGAPDLFFDGRLWTYLKSARVADVVVPWRLNQDAKHWS